MSQTQAAARPRDRRQDRYFPARLLAVIVIALPPPPVFLTPKGFAHVGPRAFGYDLDFRSVFQR